MSRLNILTASALVALTAIVSCDEQYDYYKVGKNNPTVTTLEVSEEQVGDNWVVLAGSVKWEQSTSNHSFDVRFAVSESPDFPADETDTLYGETSSRKSIAQDDTTTHYYEQAIDGLKQGTTYYYAFSITDGIVEVSGKTQSFTTLGENQDDPNNPTGGPRLVIPEPGYAADAVGSDASVGFVIENYDVGLYGELSEEMFLVEHGDGGEDWIMDLAYGAVEYGENECTGYVAFIVKPNETDSDRSCSISVRLSIEGVVDQEEFIYITQPSMTAEEPNLVMPEGTEFSVEAEGGDYDTFIPFTIENYSYEYYESHGEPELWIENGADWLSNVEYAYLEYEPGGNCTGYINLTAAPNTTGSDRTGSFTFGFNDQSYDISISQPAGEAGDATGELNGHEWVDLGLSVRWATCNVGASLPSDYGDYYAWGEIETKTEYFPENSITWEQDMSDISGNPRYDAATANWGEGWRLPSSDELKELADECTWVWITENGHNGFKITGPNGHYIFIPAADDKLFDFEPTVGELGHYWSSSPETMNYVDGEGADMLCFNNESDKGSVFGAARWQGLNVRPVTDK